MKYKLKLILLAVAFFIFGCSNDDDNETEPVVELPSVFSMDVNGESYLTNITPVVYKIENNFMIKTVMDGIRFSFNESGQFGSLYIDLNNASPNQTSEFYSFREYSSNYFDFNLAEVDLIHKRVKGTYSGYLHSDPGNINSEIKFVTGSFDTKYEDMIPAVVGLGNHAKINGEDWVSTSKYMTRGSGATLAHITQHDVSDDQYKIMVKYNQNATPVGVYNFTAADATNRIQLAKFDPATATYTNYDCAGTLTVTRREQEILGGTYSFTAINPTDPTDIIQVTDGNFKLIFYYWD